MGMKKSIDIKKAEPEDKKLIEDGAKNRRITVIPSGSIDKIEYETREDTY